MKAPLSQMTKKEILTLYKFRCNHGHNGISHYNCYRKEGKVPERIGFLDIEASNLKANFGIMLSYCIKKENNPKIYKGVVTKKELMSGDMDKRLIQDCIRDMRRFDRLIGHYSSRYDFPFIRTRAIIHHVPFPEYGEILQTDTWRMARSVLCLHSNRQDVIAESLQGHTVKTRIKQKHWIGALQGNPKSLAYVLDHNMKDVLDLERNYHLLKSFTVKTNKSL